MGNKQIELFVFRPKRSRSLERLESLAHLTVPRVRLREQVFDSSAIVWASVQCCQNWNGFLEFTDADVAEGQVEFHGIFTRNAPLGSQKMRDRFGKRSMLGQRDSQLQIGFGLLLRVRRGLQRRILGYMI